MTLAKVFVTGKVVKNPEKRFTQNDLPITTFPMDFNPQEESIVRVSAVGNLADTVEQTIKMGDSVLVEGRLQTNTTKGTNGRDKKVFEINASTVEKISGTTPPQAQASMPAKESFVQFATEEISDNLIDEDEIPF